MESTTEQSHSQPSQPQQQQQPQSDSLLSEADSLLDYQPEQSEPLLSEPLHQSSDEPQPQTTEVTTEVETTQTDVEPIIEEQTSTFEFSSIDDIDIETIPTEARTYVEPILNHVIGLRNDLANEKLAYEDMRDQFTTLLETVDEATKGNLEPIIEEYEVVHTAFTQISTENVNLSHKLFEMEYPEYEQQSDEVKRAFAEALVHPSFNDRFVGDSLYDKMVDAYKLTMYRMGATPVSAKPQPRQTQQVAPEPKRQPNPQAVKQSLVSGGSMAPNLPTLNLQEMSYEDILSRGEHLLDL